jgi:hypothetical protein
MIIFLRFPDQSVISNLINQCGVQDCRSVRWAEHLLDNITIPSLSCIVDEALDRGTC